jgi:thioredoxin-related protein
MNTRTLLTLLFSIVSTLSVLASGPPSFFVRGDLSDIQTRSRTENRPLLIYVAAEGAPESVRMQQHTWTDESLQQWIEAHYLAYFQAISPDSFQRLQLPHYWVESVPTLLIYHPEGRLMGSVEGYVAPQTLEQILKRHHARVQPIKPVAVMPFRCKTPMPITVQAPSRRSTIDLQVQGLEAYSLSHLPPASQLAPTLGLRVGKFDSYRKVRREIRRMEKVWPGEMWVYAQSSSLNTRAQDPVYMLVLGTFEDVATAHRYADAMYRYTSKTAILDLRQLLE